MMDVAPDRQSPPTKSDTVRQRLLDQQNQWTDVPMPFSKDSPDHANGETPHYRQIIQRAVSTLPERSDLNVVFDCCFNAGEAEHKFASFVRTQRAPGQLSPGLHYSIFGFDSELITIVLLLHEPHMTIVRSAGFGPAIELVGIHRLRIAIAQDYGNNERHIDDFVAMWLLLGTDYMPGAASFEMLAEGYRGFGNGYLVENGELDRDFFE
jgi:hypothetical protein